MPIQESNKIIETMATHSVAYTEIINLINLAVNHRSMCNNEDCRVSFYLIKRTVNRLLHHVWPTEKQDIILKITGTNWN